jgi:hypothetical protein
LRGNSFNVIPSYWIIAGAIALYEGKPHGEDVHFASCKVCKKEGKYVFGFIYKEKMVISASQEIKQQNAQ